MAHKSLKGRKKPRKSTGVRKTLKASAKSRKTSRQMKADHKKMKAEEREKKAAEEQAKREAALAATKAAEEEAAKAAAPRAKKGKKRKSTGEPAAAAPAPAEPAAAAAPAVLSATPAAALAPDAAAEEPQRPLRGKDKRKLRAQAALEHHHQALYTGGRVLLVGEGNFSFARALCRHLKGGEGVFATCLDGESLLKRKYPDAAECRKEIEENFGGTTLVGVDATRLHDVRQFRRAFRTVVWNFPHLGGGEADVGKSVADHQTLLTSFFQAAVRCLDEEEGASIHVSLKSREPYKSWKIKQTARAACPELELRSVVAFAPSAWSGYEHRRTVGFDERFSKRDSEELAAGAKVYVFVRGGGAPAQVVE